MSGADSNRGLEALWDDHARFDPLWAVLACDKKRGRAWDLRDFMRQGEREIAPMHGISREVVVNRLEGKGSESIEIEDDPRAGHEWLSYRYFVRKV